ncbi:transglutaminase-like cysteine peptidase [Desulfovibrio sp. OttesenSCG-928-F20]|nr:transglutaminase-like cysteine peptidase [Desulfovibrio sp. OttesenSCG-928-F20]
MQKVEASFLCRLLISLCALCWLLIAPAAALALAESDAPAKDVPPPRATNSTSVASHEEACADTEPKALCLTGYVSMRIAEIPREQRYLWLYWQRVLDEHKPEDVFGVKQCILPSHHLTQWKNLSALMPSLAPDKKLRYINGFFNNFQSKKDMDCYGSEDYWATPEEFMRQRGGDCEDYAIIKYLALSYFGWSTNDMWLLIVKNRKNSERHAVLAVYQGQHTFILDNLTRPAYMLVPEKTFLTGFVPLFAINEHGFWFFAGTGE